MFADLESNKEKGGVVDGREIAGDCRHISPISGDLKDVGEIAKGTNHHESANCPRERIAVNEARLGEGHSSAKNPETSSEAYFSKVNWILADRHIGISGADAKSIHERRSPSQGAERRYRGFQAGRAYADETCSQESEPCFAQEFLASYSFPECGTSKQSVLPA